MPSVLLMVGTAKGAFFFRSDLQREAWEIEGPMFKGWEVLDLRLDPRTETLYAAVSHSILGNAVQVSRDFGRSWNEMQTVPTYGEDSGRRLNRIWCVVPGPASAPAALYAGVDEAGLFVSRDGGPWLEVEALNDHPTREAWAATHGGLCCHTVLIDPADEDRMWVGISAAGVFRSDDGGASWEVKNVGLPPTAPSEKHPGLANCVHHLEVCSGDSNVLYQQNHGGVFRSLDGADTWHRIEEGLESNFGLPMALDPFDDKRLFVAPVMEGQLCHLPIGGRLVVYRTDDGGESWRPLTNGLPQDRYYAHALRQGLATDGLPECGVYLGTTSGDVFYSRDAGERWQCLPGFSRLPRITKISVVRFAE